MPKFKVTLCQVVYQFAKVIVEAPSREAAKSSRLACCQLDNLDWGDDWYGETTVDTVAGVSDEEATEVLVDEDGEAVTEKGV